MAPDTHLAADENFLIREYNDKDGICTLTLNRPEKRNPLSTQLLGELQNALNEGVRKIGAKG